MTQDFVYPGCATLREWLAQTPTASQDVVVLITGALAEHEPTLADLRDYLDDSIRLLRDGGLLFVQGSNPTASRKQKEASCLTSGFPNRSNPSGSSGGTPMAYTAPA